MNYFRSSISSSLSFSEVKGAIDTEDFESVLVGAVDANEASDPLSDCYSFILCCLRYTTAGLWLGLVRL